MEISDWIKVSDKNQTPISPRHAVGGQKDLRVKRPVHVNQGQADMFRIQTQAEKNYSESVCRLVPKIDTGGEKFLRIVTRLPSTACTSQQLHNMRKEHDFDLISLRAWLVPLLIVLNCTDLHSTRKKYEIVCQPLLIVILETRAEQD